MREIRCFVDQTIPVGHAFLLPDAVQTHVIRVLRMKVGDELSLFNGDGHFYHAQLTASDKRGVYVTVNAMTAHSVESPLHVTLLQGISRGERMDYTVQKAVELGVYAIHPVITERCGVQLDAARWQKKQEHWQSIVIAACEQSGRTVVPRVHAVQKLDRAVAELSEGQRFVLDPLASTSFSAASIKNSVALLAGPEGGLSDLDMAVAHSAAFTGIRMGPRILRTETAALAALSVLQTLYGDLR